MLAGEKVWGHYSSTVLVYPLFFLCFSVELSFGWKCDVAIIWSCILLQAVAETVLLPYRINMVYAYSLADGMQGVQVKLCNPLDNACYTWAPYKSTIFIFYRFYQMCGSLNSMAAVWDTKVQSCQQLVINYSQLVTYLSLTLINCSKT